MKTNIAQLMLLIVGLLHIYFFILETFLWTKPIGLKTFAMSEEQAKTSKDLAANQGLYNLFLAMGLISSLFFNHPLVALSFQVFFLSCVSLAGLYAFLTLEGKKGRKILLIQFFPAALTLSLLLFSN